MLTIILVLVALALGLILGAHLHLSVLHHRLTALEQGVMGRLTGVEKRLFTALEDRLGK